MKNTELVSYLKNSVSEFGVVPFWFLNHYPEENLLREQIRKFAEQHCGGLMLHARDGLRGGYLNESWKKCVSVVLDEAKKHQLKVWLYDENHYPSGEAGGLVHDKFPDALMLYLELEYADNKAPVEKYDKLLHVEGKYLGFKIRTQPRKCVDYFDSEAMNEFVHLSYTWYAENFKEDFGTTIPGEFTDNSCANFATFRRSVPWMRDMPERFRAYTGKEIDEVIPSLFFQRKESALHRLIFWRFFSKAYIDSFVGKIEAECQKNGIAATGHYCIEDGTSEHVRQLGDRFEQKKHQQLPGVDMLGAHAWDVLGKFPVNTASALIEMTTSASYFYHGSRSLCECFGLSDIWGMTLSEMRRISGTLAAFGIDLFVPHGLFYSISGHRKRECIPDFLHNPMWESFSSWALYAARIASLTAFSQHIADTALLYPVTSQEASMVLTGKKDFEDVPLSQACEHGDPGRCYTNHGSVCNTIDNAMKKCADLLLQNAIPFEVVNEEILCSADVQNGELLIPLPKGGCHAVKTLILPSTWILNEATLQKLMEFSRNGGKIISLEQDISAVFDGTEVRSFVPQDKFYSAKYPDFTQNNSQDQGFLEQVRQGMKHSRIRIANAENKLVLKEWLRADGQYFAMIHNISRDILENVSISADFSPVIADIENLTFSRIKDKSFQKTFYGGETLILCENDEPCAAYCPPSEPVKHCSIAPSQWKVELEGPNTLFLGEMKCTYPKGSCLRVFTSSFEVEKMPSSLGIAIEVEPTDNELRAGIHPFTPDSRVYPENRCKLFINDVQVTDLDFGTHFDHWIYEADILNKVHPGINTIRLEQFNAFFAIHNSIPDPILITGNFGVVNQRIVPPSDSLPNPCWHDSSLKNYSGAVNFTAEIDLPEDFTGKPCELRMEKVHEIAEVFINGISCGERVCAPWHFPIPCDMTRMGHVTLRLRVRNTPANRWQEAPLPSGITGKIEIVCFE